MTAALLAAAVAVAGGAAADHFGGPHALQPETEAGAQADAQADVHADAQATNAPAQPEAGPEATAAEAGGSAAVDAEIEGDLVQDDEGLARALAVGQLGSGDLLVEEQLGEESRFVVQRELLVGDQPAILEQSAVGRTSAGEIVVEERVLDAFDRDELTRCAGGFQSGVGVRQIVQDDAGRLFHAQEIPLDAQGTVLACQPLGSLNDGRVLVQAHVVRTVAETDATGLFAADLIGDDLTATEFEQETFVRTDVDSDVSFGTDADLESEGDAAFDDATEGLPPERDVIGSETAGIEGGQGEFEPGDEEPPASEIVAP